MRIVSLSLTSFLNLQAALYDKRPNLVQLTEKKPFPSNVRPKPSNPALLVEDQGS